MWKKDETTPSTPATPEPKEAHREQAPPIPSSRQPERAVIGRSISIVGEVKGNEDLLIQGKIEGTVDLREQAVTIGSDGEVKADITGRVVAVDGSVEGNLHAQEQVILRSSARVQGDITAPRVVLEDGARFRGLVDMGDPARAEKSAAEGPALQSKKDSDGENKESPTSGGTSKSSGNSGTKASGSVKAEAEAAQAAVS
jgi:cytoskeletal protein CcmA (bactofilin family)